jgi:predicted transcriptional regulator
MSRGVEEKSTRLEEAAKRIEELTQERINLEKANAELREQLKDWKKAHQGKPYPMLEYLLLSMTSHSETCASLQILRNSLLIKKSYLLM